MTKQRTLDDLQREGNAAIDTFFRQEGSGLTVEKILRARKLLMEASVNDGAIDGTCRREPEPLELPAPGGTAVGAGGACGAGGGSTEPR